MEPRLESGPGRIPRGVPRGVSFPKKRVVFPGN